MIIQATDAPAASILSFSSKAPPLPKELAEDLLNKNKNKLIRAAITASRADPVLANAQEIAFTKALSKVESKCEYVFRLHSRALPADRLIVLEAHHIISSGLS